MVATITTKMMASVDYFECDTSNSNEDDDNDDCDDGNEVIKNTYSSFVFIICLMFSLVAIYSLSSVISNIDPKLFNGLKTYTSDFVDSLDCCLLILLVVVGHIQL